ncbi:hypothetical protein MW084_22110 [Streptomyces sudanensis]|uniref:Uncharacterized protein n=1 Tax=Streptomyces sudanensis TaxID=436397 RepID=A0ABY4TN67_9ACTN|nr:MULTISPECIES: hypothetical protein [Streptomyces]URN18182.1 hypothetical protein MW084_22110 [Streptomyces sudanensis]
MTCAPTRRRVEPEQLAAFGAAFAGALLPLALGVLFAKAMAADPMAPVNAFVTGGARTRLSPAHLRGCGPGRLRRHRTGAAARRPGRSATPAAERPVPESAASGT